MTLKKIISNKKYLFLDRDGVINERIPNGYITKWEDFHFIDGVVDALVVFSNFFDRIIIITNQQGIGKGLMSKLDVERIHRKLIQLIHEKGGKIDAVYYCGELSEKKDNCRKPAIKMAMQAKSDFPEIRFSKSIMIGDTKSDMDFANNTGMTGIFMNSIHASPEDLKSSDYLINTLDDISKYLV